MTPGKRTIDLKADREVNAASYEAIRGAVYGASVWGVGAGLLSGAAYLGSPLYRGLTVQFKIFLVMSGMVLGGMIEADRRMIAYEKLVRVQKRMLKDAAVWRAYEESYERPSRGGEKDGG